MLDLVHKAMKSGAENVSLDYLLRVLPDDFQIPGAVKNATPAQFFTTSHCRLQQPGGTIADRRPPLDWLAIESTQLEFVVNTDWDIFHQKESDTWYVLDQGSWLSNNMLSSGDWFSTTELPEGLPEPAV